MRAGPCALSAKSKVTNFCAALCKNVIVLLTRTARCCKLAASRQRAVVSVQCGQSALSSGQQTAEQQTSRRAAPLGPPLCARAPNFRPTQRPLARSSSAPALSFINQQQAAGPAAVEECCLAAGAEGRSAKKGPLTRVHCCCSLANWPQFQSERPLSALLRLPLNWLETAQRRRRLSGPIWWAST